MDNFRKPKANILLHSRTMNASCIRLGTRQGCPLSQILGFVLECLARTIKEEKKREEEPQLCMLKILRNFQKWYLKQ